jgi:hypothetical protein
VTVKGYRDLEAGIVKALLTVTERENYWAVACGTCAALWQTPIYAAENVG